MLSKLHDRLGTAGLIVAVVALVAAVAGTALAAGGLTAQQEKQVKKIAKKYAGKPGPVGPVGPAGPTGSPGSPGAAGKEGGAGPKGPTGPTGLTVTGPTGVCGAPPCTLPSGVTETGAWSYGKTSTGPIEVTASFALPLGTAIAHGKAHFIYITGKELVENSSFELEEVTKSPDCPGTAAAPSALGGSFCMYAAGMTGALTTGIFLESGSLSNPGLAVGSSEETGKTGARLLISLESGSSEGWGTWAVKAP